MGGREARHLAVSNVIPSVGNELADGNFGIFMLAGPSHPGAPIPACTWPMSGRIRAKLEPEFCMLVSEQQYGHDNCQCLIACSHPQDCIRVWRICFGGLQDSFSQSASGISFRTAIFTLSANSLLSTSFVIHLAPATPTIKAPASAEKVRLICVRAPAEEMSSPAPDP